MKTVSLIAKETGIARSSLIRWRDRENVDIQDPSALARRIAEMPPRPSYGDVVANQSCDKSQGKVDATAESHSNARRRREIATADRAETIAARERGELVPIVGIHHDGEKIGRAVQASLNELANQLPPRLAGRDAAEVDQIIRTEFRRVMQDLSDRSDLFPVLT